jgi:D-3-phosphoglycerate dehydrogenase
MVLSQKISSVFSRNFAYNTDQNTGEMSMSSHKVLLLENIHPSAIDLFNRAGFSDVTLVKGAMEEDELIAALQDVHLLGIRSKTRVTEKALKSAPQLAAVGCFCIGTDQVDLNFAESRGLPVFNAPYANTRSVAELVLGEIIMLMRRIPVKNEAAHKGEWLKAVDGATEIRGKTLGIVGYGHIGTQLSVLAENLGMRILFYDVIDKLSLGNARKCATLDELLMQSDVVTMHVPSTLKTKMMMGKAQLQKMKQGALLINASRGKVVDFDALTEVLKTGHLAGAAIDVFPVEPANNGELLETPLRGLPNVILTPHIGGSTLEAQENIAGEVADKLIRYLRDGLTYGSVNMPQINLPPVEEGQTRFRHIHQNVPGVLAKINDVFSSRNLNIAGQYLQTTPRSGYVVIDIDGTITDFQIRNELAQIPGTIKAL